MLSLYRRAVLFAQSFWTDAGKQAAGNLAGVIACQGFSLVCQLVNLIVLPKALGLPIYGQYVSDVAFFPYFYCVGSLAGGAIALRDIRQNPDRFNEIASSFLTLAAVLSLAQAALAVAILPFVPIADDERFLMGVVAVGAIFPCLGLTSLFDAHHRQGLGAFASAAVECVNTATLFALAAIGTLDLRAAAWLLLGRWSLTTVLQWGLFQRFVRPISLRATAAAMRQILTASVSPVLMALIWNANSYLSIILVRQRFGDSETAIYGNACAIATIAIATNDLVLRIVGPHILGEHGLRPDFLRKLAVFLTAFTLALSLAAFLGAMFLVHFVLDPAFRALLTPLAWLLAAGAARAVWAVNDWYLLRFHKQHISLLAMFGTAIGSSLFGWLTPTDLGASGFPIGMLIFFTAAAIFTTLAARRAYGALTLRA